MKNLACSFAVLWLVVFVMGNTHYVEASSVVRSGETVTIAADQEVTGDFYGLAGTVAISGVITEDLVVAGGTVALNGTVAADALVAAGEVNINGSISDDVRVVAGRVTVAGEVTGNLVVFASELKVLSTAKIGGDILFFGDYADIAGVVGKDVLGTSKRLRIDGEIIGGLNVTSETVMLGDKAAITKNVVYSSASDLVRSQNATVGGEAVRNSVTVNEVHPLKKLLVPLFIIFFATLVWFLVFKRSVVKMVTSVLSRPVMTGVIGLPAFLLLPTSGFALLIMQWLLPIPAFVFMSVLCMVVIATLVTFFVLASLISLSLVGVVVGAFLRKRFLKKTDLTLTFSAIGVLVFGLVFVIPVIGPILCLAVFLLTFGAVCERFYLLLRD